MQDLENRYTRAVGALCETARKNGTTVLVEAIIGDTPAYPLIEYVAERDNSIRLGYGDSDDVDEKLGLSLSMDCGDTFEVGTDCIHFMMDGEPGRIFLG